MGKFEDYAYNIKFVVRRQLYGLEVGDTPWFDPDGGEFYARALRGARTYLEYGSGGSTVLAAGIVDRLVSVESDHIFARAVRAKVEGSRANTTMLMPDIGFTRHLGIPFFAKPRSWRVRRWKTYPKAPWAAFPDLKPDLVLIDGRFRVACALETLLHVDHEVPILIDDYVGRDYRAVEQFADLVGMHGRMAHFRRKHSIDSVACKSVLEDYYRIVL
jgi:hypothetical protein